MGGEEGEYIWGGGGGRHEVVGPVIVCIHGSSRESEKISNQATYLTHLALIMKYSSTTLRRVQNLMPAAPFCCC